MLPVVEAAKPASLVARSPALKRAGLSLLIPGLGQWLQHRPIIAAIHFSTVLLAALDASTPVTIGLAIAARLWSAHEAYRHEQNSPSPQPDEEV